MQLATIATVGATQRQAFNTIYVKCTFHWKPLRCLRCLSWYTVLNQNLNLNIVASTKLARSWLKNIFCKLPTEEISVKKFNWIICYKALTLPVLLKIKALSLLWERSFNTDTLKGGKCKWADALRLSILLPSMSPCIISNHQWPSLMFIRYLLLSGVKVRLLC